MAVPELTTAYSDGGSLPVVGTSTGVLAELARFVGAPIEDVVKSAECNELRSFFVRTDNGGPTFSPKPMPRPKPPKSGRHALIEILAKRPMDPIRKPSKSGRQVLIEIMGKRWPP